MPAELDLDDLAQRATKAAQGWASGCAISDVQPLTGGASSLTFTGLVTDGPIVGERVVLKVAPPGLEPVRNRDVARQALAAGVDIFRLNFSHGTMESHGAVIERIRRAAEAAGRHTAILQDLGGPKIRTGSLQDGTLSLKAGEELTIAAGDFVGAEGSESIVLSDIRHGTYKKLVVADGRLTGAVLVGDTGDALWYLELIRNREPIAAVRRDMMFGRSLAIGAKAA